MEYQFPFPYRIFKKQSDLFFSIDEAHKHESPEDRENRYRKYYYFKHLRRRHEFFCVPRTGIKHFIESYVEKANKKEILNIYELVTEGSVCKIYFDLEEENPNSKEENELLLDQFLVDVKTFFKPSSDRDIETTCMVFDGCRSNNKGDYKWSYHVILTNAQYKNNSIVMKKWVMRFLEKFPKYSKIVDRGVYTKNRVFRMLWSSKSDNKRLEFDSERSSAIYEKIDKRNLFYNSFISMNPDYTIIDPMDVSRSNSSTSTASRSSRSHYSANLDFKHKKIILDFLKEQGNNNASITKTWSIPNHDTIGISTDNKKCIFANRDHKSNNTYFMIYNSKKEDFQIVFKCHDELCKNKLHQIYPKENANA